jgi:hypothetical protein
MRRNFWGFCRNWFLKDPLTLPFEPFRFRLRIRGDIRNRKTTPRLGKSVSRGVDDYDYEYLREFEVKIGTARNEV